MINHKKQIFAVIAFVCLAIWPSFAGAGFVAYQVSVNTSALGGQGGNLDFQFNPGGSSAESATVTVTSFQTIGGSLSQPAIHTGNATGSLPGTLTLNNGTVYNDAFQGFSYGNNFSFILTLSGQALNSPGGTFGSSFALSLYDAAGVTPLLTTDPNGSVLTVNINPSGSTSVFTFPQSNTSNSSVVTITPFSSVPEPSSIVMQLLATAFALIYHRSKSTDPLRLRTLRC